MIGGDGGDGGHGGGDRRQAKTHPALPWQSAPQLNRLHSPCSGSAAAALCCPGVSGANATSGGGGAPPPAAAAGFAEAPVGGVSVYTSASMCGCDPAATT